MENDMYRYSRCTDPRDPDYVGPEDFDGDEDNEPEFDEPDTWHDEAEADYIMTDAENRGLL